MTAENIVALLWVCFFFFAPDSMDTLDLALLQNIAVFVNNLMILYMLFLFHCQLSGGSVGETETPIP